jgi:phosphatidyl-myo-inositol dimannoside synthase
MRVLALLPNAYDDGGGIAQYNRDLLTALALVADVSEIRLCCLSVGSEKKISARPAKISIEKTCGSKWHFGFASIAEIVRFKPDIIFCGHLGLLKLLTWLPNQKKWKLWLQLHGIEAWPVANKKTRRIASTAWLVTCVSRFTRTKALSWLALEPERIKVLPNTVNENFYPGNSKDHSDKFQEKIIILTVGRLSSAEQYKGQDKVIAALPEISQKYPDIMYLIAGTGDDEIRLRNLAQLNNVEAQVKFLGHVSNDELPDLYRRASLYVMPSTGEGFGIAYLEAMACGTPALGLNADGSVDPLGDGELGLCLNTDHSLARAIIEVLKMPRDKLALSTKVKNRFGRAVFNQHIANLLVSASASVVDKL